MTAIPTRMYSRLREILLDCGPFGDDHQLRVIFAHAKLNPWRHSVPQASTPANRVDAAIAFLAEWRYADTEENGLVLLLGVLTERTDPTDDCHQRLTQLAKDFDRTLRGSSLDEIEELVQELKSNSVVIEKWATTKQAPLLCLQSLESYLDKDWQGSPQLFRPQPVPKWVDYQFGFIPPSPAVGQILEVYESTRFVNLIGPMRFGKSTTAYRIGFRLATVQNWKIFIVPDVREFVTLWDEQQTWQLLKTLDVDNILVIFDDIHLVDRKKLGNFFLRARQEFSNLKFLFVGRPLPSPSGRWCRAASELSSIPVVECQTSRDLIATLIKMRLTQLQLPTAPLSNSVTDAFTDQCGGDLFILTRLLRHWDGDNLPPLAEIAKHVQADLREILASETLGVNGITMMFIVACLHEVELEAPVKLLTDALGIPWQVVNALIEQQEVIDIGSRLKFIHASQASLIREAVEQSAVLKSAVRSAVVRQISHEYTGLELRLIPYLIYMLCEPQVAARICSRLSSTDGREADLLELWRQPVLEKLFVTALAHESSYFLIGFYLFEIVHAIHEVDPSDANQQTQRLIDVVSSLQPVLVSKLERASVDDVVDFLMMPMIWPSLAKPLLEILSSVDIKEHLNKLRKTTDVGTIGLYLGYIFSNSAGAELGSKIVTESFDYLINMVASSENAEGVRRITHAIAHVDANLAARLLRQVQAAIKMDVCNLILQLISDDEQWDDPEALRACFFDIW